MSQRNLEISRRINDLWNVGDMEGIEQLLREDVVGGDAVLRQFELLREGGRSDRLETVDRRGAGDCVAVRQIWQAQGDQSGAASEMTVSSVARYATARSQRSRSTGTTPTR